MYSNETRNKNKRDHHIVLVNAKGSENMIHKYIYYNEPNVYAVYYRTTKIIYYNLNFIGKIQLILFI